MQMPQLRSFARIEQYRNSMWQSNILLPGVTSASMAGLFHSSGDNVARYAGLLHILSRVMISLWDGPRRLARECDECGDASSDRYYGRLQT